MSLVVRFKTSRVARPGNNMSPTNPIPDAEPKVLSEAEKKRIVEEQKRVAIDERMRSMSITQQKRLRRSKTGQDRLQYFVREPYNK